MNRMTLMNDTSYFYEKINITKLKYIIDNATKYQDIINEQERDMRRYKNYDAFAVFQKLVHNCVVLPDVEGTEFAYVKVKYRKGENSNNIGRWYCDKSIGLQSLSVSVRHTICEGIWTDIDQVNSHPTIFKSFMDKYGFESKLLDLCLNDRENFLKSVGGKRELAKTQVIAVINGAKYPNNKILHQLHLEIQPCIDFVINLPEYSGILEYVSKTYKDNISGKSISRVLQVIENDLLECYIEWANNKGFIENNQIVLIFDGFQLLSKYNITDDMLNECADYAKEQTGYYIPLKVKPFDNPLILPEDYNLQIDTITSLINKYSVGLVDFVKKNSKLILNCLNSDGSHYEIAKTCSILFKDSIYYDDDCDRWFYSDINNIWKECKRGLVLKSLLQSVFKESFPIYSKLYCTDLENYEQAEIARKCRKIYVQLQNSSFVSSILKHDEFYIKTKFYSDYLDSKNNLFAFKDKVFDFHTNTIRLIKQNDYIMTNTGYKYPEYIQEEDSQFLQNYFETLFPNEDTRNYVLDSSCIALNANRQEQFFNIHTGNGSNSKTTFNNLFESAVGEYACEISPETFTKPKKSANDTGELYKAKGKRVIFTNEPESDQDKLQTALLKRIADESGRKIIARALYQDPIEFPITFILNFFCNNKPELSSVDGGIARRLRIIDWRVKFVDNPDPDNIYQKPCNPDVMKKMRTEGVKMAFIRMLIDRWTDRVSKFKLIPVPKEIVDASNDYVDDSNPVLGFITDNYDITNNENDKVSSSAIFTEFSYSCRDNKISSKRFKDDILGISGIQSCRTKKGVYFSGLKKKAEEEEDE